MRMSSDEAFANWADAKVMASGDKMLSRVEWANANRVSNIESDLSWAFHAGWVAAISNLTTQDNCSE